MVRAHLQLVNSGITPWMEKLTNCSSCISKDRIGLEFSNFYTSIFTIFRELS